MDEERWPSATMGQVRAKELMRWLENLGVIEHRWLDGPVDVDMEGHLVEAGSEKVRAMMARRSTRTRSSPSAPMG